MPYTRFCKETGFTSKLDRDKQAQKEAELEELKQTTIDGHFTEAPPATEGIKLPYSDENFKQLAIRWLVSCDLVS